MSYKTGRGNVAKKCLRFHAPVKMVFDYQSVTKYAVAVSRRCKRPDEGVAASLLGGGKRFRRKVRFDYGLLLHLVLEFGDFFG